MHNQSLEKPALTIKITKYSHHFNLTVLIVVKLLNSKKSQNK